MLSSFLMAVVMAEFVRVDIATNHLVEQKVES